MEPIKTVGIISKPNISHAPEIVRGLLEWLRNRGVEYRCDEETARYADQALFFPRDEVPDGAQFVIVLGGDGTLLSAARAIGGRDIPLFAVNLGGLGFLTAITLEELYPELERAFRGEARIGRRRMLDCELIRNGHTIGSYSALNDVVVTKSMIARMIDLDTYVDDHFVCRVQGGWARHRHAHGLNGVFTFGWRTCDLPLGRLYLYYADLPAHFDESPGDRLR